MDLIFLLVGVGLLYLGGEGLVRGAVTIGRRSGLSSIVIGLTIVSIGTSSPELAATIAGVLAEAPAVALGNVIGSNIANLGLVLGATALIWPLRVAARFVRREVPVMLLVSSLMFPFVINGSVGRLEGVGLLIALAAYLAYLLSQESETAEVEAEFEEAYGRGRLSLWWSFAAVLVGIGSLIAGADLMIRGAVGMARTIGISERVIGLTVVALGTSLPEMASSVVAALRHEGDIVLGNLIGSNIFNILFILGTASIVRPIAVETAAVWPDLIAMMAVSVVTWIFLHSGSQLARWEGCVLFTSYGAYILYLFL